MSDYEERLAESRELDAEWAEKRHVRRFNSGLRRRALQYDTPPPYLCDGCHREVDLCKCEDQD